MGAQKSMQTIHLDNKTIFVTGVAGFIESNLVKRLLKDVKGANIIDIDRVMQGAPERKKGEHGFPIPPYSVYNIDK
jgi:nucleoside-diphosphate-sugar epimerase